MPCLSANRLLSKLLPNNSLEFPFTCRAKFLLLQFLLLLTPDAYGRDSGWQLTINTVYKGAWDLWPQSMRLGITYCVSSQFGIDYNTVVQALDEAIRDWETVAHVNYTHIPSLDSNCFHGDNRVTFQVLPIANQNYLMRAFFPSSLQSDRNIMVDASALRNTYQALVGYFRHEIGHTLGFRHEHIRVTGTCGEEGTWIPLTTYDSASVMHYPHCPNGTGNLYNLVLTDLDREGARSAYPAFQSAEPFCSNNPCSSDGTPL